MLASAFAPTLPLFSVQHCARCTLSFVPSNVRRSSPSHHPVSGDVLCNRCINQNDDIEAGEESPYGHTPKAGQRAANPREVTDMVAGLPITDSTSHTFTNEGCAQFLYLVQSPVPPHSPAEAHDFNDMGYCINHPDTPMAAMDMNGYRPVCARCIHATSASTYATVQEAAQTIREQLIKVICKPVCTRHDASQDMKEEKGSDVTCPNLPSAAYALDKSATQLLNITRRLLKGLDRAVSNILKTHKVKDGSLTLVDSPWITIYNAMMDVTRKIRARLEALGRPKLAISRSICEGLKLLGVKLDELIPGTSQLSSTPFEEHVYTRVTNRRVSSSNVCIEATVLTSLQGIRAILESGDSLLLGLLEREIGAILRQEDGILAVISDLEQLSVLYESITLHNAITSLEVMASRDYWVNSVSVIRSQRLRNLEPCVHFAFRSLNNDIISTTLSALIYPSCALQPLTANTLKLLNQAHSSGNPDALMLKGIRWYNKGNNAFVYFAEAEATGSTHSLLYYFIAECYRRGKEGVSRVDEAKAVEYYHKAISGM